jgi:polyisoprenyl-teichoic acid--peptidoglycan teichoic acid transferase
MAQASSGGGAAPRRRLLRWGAGIGGAIVVLGGGATAWALRSRYGVPHADLGVGTPTPTPAPGQPTQVVTPPPGQDIPGPLNILLAGVDTRVSVPGWEPHADAVLILHVPASLDKAYLFALPRDLRVDIPAFAKSGFGGQRTKLTHAMSYGSRRPGGGEPSAAQGFQLLAKTVTAYTGINHFNAGAVINFGGFTHLVDALGGVEMYIDQKIVSKHRQPNGKHRRAVPGGYAGPQMVYEKGLRRLNGWQALDVARQRYLTGGAYARQRHQQQLIKALARQILSRDAATNPAKLDAVLRAVGKALIVDPGGHKVIDYAYTLRKLRPDAITLVALPGGSVGSGGGYIGEQLQQPVGRQFFAALKAGTLDTFLTTHPKLVVK